MSLTIHSKYNYFDSTVQKAEDRRQKFYFCRFPFAVNVKLNLSNEYYLLLSVGLFKIFVIILFSLQGLYFEAARNNFQELQVQFENVVHFLEHLRKSGI